MPGLGSQAAGAGLLWTPGKLRNLSVLTSPSLNWGRSALAWGHAN